MSSSSSKYLQMAAYIMFAAIFIITIGVTRNCGRINYTPKEGFSGGDTIDIALIYGPGSYYIYGDTLAGINQQIAEMFGKETSSPIKLWPITEPASGLTNLNSGAYDILASLPLDNNIKKNYPVSESIFLDRLVLIQKHDSISENNLVSSSLDLNGKTIYVPAGSSAVNRLQNLSEEIGGKIEIIELPDISDELLTLKVATGETPLAVVNERIARAMAENYPDLSYDSSVSFTQFQVWVFNPSDTLLVEKFNSWFDTFNSMEQYRTILNKF